MIKIKRLLALLLTAIMLLSCLPANLSALGTNIVSDLVKYNGTGDNTWNASTGEVNITTGWNNYRALRLNPKAGTTFSLTDLKSITIELESAIDKNLFFYFYSQNGSTVNDDPSSSYAIGTDTNRLDGGQTSATLNITSVPSGATELKQIKFYCDALTVKIKGIYLNYAGDEPEEPKQGTCGANLNWWLDSNGVLTISGSGNMSNYEAGTAPWYAHKDIITSIVVEDGVTSIGAYAFFDCSAVSEMTFKGTTVPTVQNSNAFGNMSALERVFVPATKYNAYVSAYADLLPAGVEICGVASEVSVYTEAKKIVSLGSQFEYQVSLAGTYDGYCFDIYAPEGMNILSVSPANTSINADNKNGFWRVSVMPGLEKVGSEKELIVTVIAVVLENAQIGERELALREVEIANITDGNSVASIDYYYAKVEIVAFIDGGKGDINGDGDFTYTDISKLYAYYRGLSEVANEVNVDINGDGSFTYTDISKLYAIYRGLSNFPE